MSATDKSSDRVPRRLLGGRVAAGVYLALCVGIVGLVLHGEAVGDVAGVVLMLLALPWSLLLKLLVSVAWLDSAAFNRVFLAAGILINTVLLAKLSARPPHGS